MFASGIPGTADEAHFGVIESMWDFAVDYVESLVICSDADMADEAFSDFICGFVVVDFGFILEVLAVPFCFGNFAYGVLCGYVLEVNGCLE